MSRERELENELVNEITNIFINDKFMNEQGELISINSFKHSLPYNYYDNEQNVAPYIISEVVGSSEDNEKAEIQVAFTLCVCEGIINGDETLNQDRHCEDDLFHIKHKIIERFKKDNLLKNKFICKNEWQFAIAEDETVPIHLAGLVVKFETVTIDTENGYDENLL